MILLTDMGDNCGNNHCSHFIGKDRFHVYRHKFLWIIVGATILTTLFFGGITMSYDTANEQVVKSHIESINEIKKLLEPAKMSKDSCYYVNEQLALGVDSYMKTSKSLLEIQSQKIQSDYAILSLWAGILMIVFLVFSIYSMFKTDEILRQSREGLKAIEDTEKEADAIIESVEKKTNLEIQKVSQKATEESEKIQTDALNTIEEVRKEISDMQSQFKDSVAEKSNEFKNMYEDMMRKMEETSKRNTTLIQQLADTIRDSSVEQKGDCQQQTQQNE